MTNPGTTTRLCTRQGLIVPQPMRVGSVLSCVLGPLPPCGCLAPCCAVVAQTLCAHTHPPHSQTVCAHSRSLPLHHDSKRTPPHPAQRAPANARAGKHKPTNKHDRDEHHNSDSSARHQVGGFCLAEILGFGTRIGNPFFTCNWDFSLEWRGFVVFGCAFWVLGCFWVG